MMDFEYKYRPPEIEEQTSQRELLTEELNKMDSREHRIRLAFENGVDTLRNTGKIKNALKGT